MGQRISSVWSNIGKIVFQSQAEFNYWATYYSSNFDLGLFLSGLHIVELI